MAALLFHYTSVDSLKKIIDSEALRLTQVSQMKNTNGTLEQDEVEQFLNQQRTAGKLKLSAAEQEELLNVRARSYCTCFAKTPSNSTLWEKVADNHQGVCLVFDLDHMKLGGQSEGTHRVLQDIFKTKAIIYDEDQLLHSIETPAVPMFPYLAMDHYKYKKYNDEDEVRLILGLQRNTHLPQSKITTTFSDGSLQQLYFEGSSYYLKLKRYERPFRLIDRCIRSIILGKECPLTVSDVNGLLEQGGFSEVVIEQNKQ